MKDPGGRYDRKDVVTRMIEALDVDMELKEKPDRD